MSNAASDTWRQSIQLNNELLARLESRQLELEKTKRAAQLAFDAAKEDLDAVTGQMVDLAAQCQKLQSQNCALRKRLTSRILQRLPFELVRMIFVEVLLFFDRDDKWPEIQDDVQAQLVQAPFALAAVCSQWRKVALHTPQLWAHIYVPLKNGTMPVSALARVTMLLERSQGAILDILLPWRNDVELAWEPDQSTHESKILLLLGRHCVRWRRFELHFSASALSHDSTMSLLRGATPQLEELCILGEDFPSNPTTPNFVPFCPKMRYFRSDLCNIVVSPTNPSLRMLTDLELFVDMPFAIIWEVLRLASPYLCVLDLQFGRDHHEQPQQLPSRIDFPRLTKLTITHEASIMFATNAALPMLSELDASAGSLPVLLSLWDATPNKVTKLSVMNEGQEVSLHWDNAQLLRPYANVDDLVVGRDCLMEATFLLALAERDSDAGWIMPALESLIICSGVQLETSHGDALIALLRARQAAHVLGGTDAPRRIGHVDLDDADVPDWLASQVRYLLDSDAQV